MPVDIIARKRDPERIVVFIRDPETDHEREKAKKLFQGFPALPALLLRNLDPLDLFDRIVFLAGPECRQGAHHQPGRNLKLANQKFPHDSQRDQLDVGAEGRFERGIGRLERFIVLKQRGSVGFGGHDRLAPGLR